MTDFYDFRESVIDLYEFEEDSIQEEAPDLYDTVKELRFFISDLTFYKALIRKSLTVKQKRKLSRMIEQLQAGTSELNQFDTFLFDSTNADINPVLVKLVKGLAVTLDILDEIQEEDYLYRKMELIETGEQLSIRLSEYNDLWKKPITQKVNELINF